MIYTTLRDLIDWGGVNNHTITRQLFEFWRGGECLELGYEAAEAVLRFGEDGVEDHRLQHILDVRLPMSYLEKYMSSWEFFRLMASESVSPKDEVITFRAKAIQAVVKHMSALLINRSTWPDSSQLSEILHTYQRMTTVPGENSDALTGKSFSAVIDYANAIWDREDDADACLQDFCNFVMVPLTNAGTKYKNPSGADFCECWQYDDDTADPADLTISKNVKGCADDYRVVVGMKDDKFFLSTAMIPDDPEDDDPKYFCDYRTLSILDAEFPLFGDQTRGDLAGGATYYGVTIRDHYTVPILEWRNSWNKLLQVALKAHPHDGAIRDKLRKLLDLYR
jgi:hypothetical protein